jgi:hypothetical protein
MEDHHYQGIDLEGRMMRHSPWPLDAAGRYRVPTKKDPGETFIISGEALRETLLLFESEGGDAGFLVDRLNAHSPLGYAVDRAALLDASRWYGPEYYFYFNVFAKKLLGDFEFCYGRDKTEPLSRYHRYYEVGKLEGPPWGVNPDGSMIKGLGMINFSALIRYLEDVLGEGSDDVLLWLGSYVAPEKRVGREFFLAEVDTTQCSYEYTSSS